MPSPTGFGDDYIMLDDVIAEIKKINPDYVIVFEDGYVKNDVLVAYVPN